MVEPIPEKFAGAPAAVVRRFVVMLADSLAGRAGRTSESELAATVERLGLEFAQLGPRCITPLERMLKSSRGVEQAITAGLVVGAAEAGVGLPFMLDAVQRAREILVRALGSSVPAERYAAAYFLAKVEAWAEARAPLMALLATDEERTRVCAAAAIVKFRGFKEEFGDAALRAQAVLLEAIRSDEPFLRSIAAGGLARDPRSNAALAHLLATLRTASPIKKRSIITELAEQGDRASVAAAELAKVAADEHESPELRGHAGYALARVVADGDAPGEKLIRSAMKSSVPEVVQGVFQGMHMCGRVPRWAYDAIGNALFEEDDETRWSAIKAIASGGEEVAAFFAATLLDRAGQESRIALVDALAEVLAAAKEHAFPLLVRVIEEEDLSRTVVFVLALVRMGSDAATALVDQVIAKAPEQAANLLPRLFMNLGKDAAPFVPVLCRWLDDDSIEDTEDIQRTLYDLGDRAVLAIPVLVRHVARRPSETTRYARAALHALGGLAKSEMDRFKETGDEAARQRLELVFGDQGAQHATEGGLEAQFAEFMGMDPDMLRVFLCMAIELAAADGPLSYGGLETRLLRLQASGKLPAHVSVQRRSLSDRMRAAGKALGGPLSTHGNRRKGVLTPLGERRRKELVRFFGLS